MYDVLKEVSAHLKVHTWAFGVSAHVAALFIAAGDVGQRRMSKNAKLVLCGSDGTYGKNSLHYYVSDASRASLFVTPTFCTSP